MALVYVDALTEGMILAEDLLTPTGRFVLAAGAAIQAEQLPLLRTWGVIEANIDEASLDDEYDQHQELIAEYTKRAETLLNRRFALNDLEQEPVATLYRHAARFFAVKLQRGWEPPAFPEVPTSINLADLPAPLSVPHLLRGDVDVVSLPTVYTHIVELLDEPNSSSTQIAKVISKDASLTVRMLRLVNSPMYGFSGKIDSVSRAVSLLGTNELTTLALGITVVRQFENFHSAQLNMESFWRHSIRCGLFAKTLAGHLGDNSVEKYFTGGLLHDIGRLVMLDRMPLQYSGAVAKARQEQLPMYRAEQDCLKTDHSIIGKLLAEKWRLSPALIRMIGSHHSPRLARYSLEACVVHIADMFAHACCHEPLLLIEIPKLELQAWTETGLSTELIAPTIQQVEKEFKEIVQIFFGNTKTEESSVG
ncbi:MAG: HDOD domain-containing protein [Deltaproteobacteria bacterium]|nr:HDOD domain-containing protein [Deltaproteobacteria bacterium]